MGFGVRLPEVSPTMITYWLGKLLNFLYLIFPIYKMRVL